MYPVKTYETQLPYMLSETSEKLDLKEESHEE